MSATTCWSRSARRTPSPGSSATSASSSTSGTCRSSTRRPSSRRTRRCSSAATRRSAQEHHLGGGARPRAAISIDKFLHGEDPAQASGARRHAGQPEDGHPRVELRQRSRRPALQGAASRQGRGAEGHQGRGRARLRPAARFKEAQRCLNCDVQTVFTAKLCIECDACVDICPMDCITFTENGEEADCAPPDGAGGRTRRRTSTFRRRLKTGRVMVKDEDVCLHCGLCAERCPTGAWDMQKYYSK
jgi:formate dehydrogenase beta subunit